eukprot:TRINITY_DN95741_c0_g1_i1.p1 TRINITY_DN95741_c0_g1~~TRINITY_DN95741_c0_g1_i1.p1  ORF type:complete len:551 (+),score=156.66 TRINITY_DN95741_c0_g1_i1:35-1654(+)
MQRGFLQSSDGRARRSSGPGAAKHESEHIARLRAALSNAELELRKRRQQRLELEGSRASFQAASQSANGSGSEQDLPTVAPDADALKALSSHSEPELPVMLHRLAVALMLLLEAPLLVDLGDHPLPTRVPWKNLQVLLRKPWGTEEAIPGKTSASAKAVAAALRQKPYGERIARHVQQRILGGDPPLTREEVNEADGRCATLLDWVENLVRPVVGGAVAKGAIKMDEAEETRQAREDSAAAIAEQEQEVAQLRRQLREAQRSEEAAEAFAAANAPDKAEIEDAAREPVREVAAGEVKSRVAQQGSIPATEVAGRKCLQYKLGEVAVPEMQEAILSTLVNSIMEPRAGRQRRLEIIGHAEDREPEDVAQKRAEAVHAWLVDTGVPAERLDVRWEAGGPVSCRRTDLQMSGAEGSDAAVRQRAADLMKRLFSQQGKGAQEEAAELQEDASCSAVAEQPAVSIEETTEAGKRQLRIVFTKEGLAARDAVLEIGAEEVRLGSASGAWKELEVPLPFQVDPPTEPAAKFSRRAGTLTLTLLAAN